MWTLHGDAGPHVSSVASHNIDNILPAILNYLMRTLHGV